MFEKFYSDLDAGFWRFSAETRILFGRAETLPRLPELCDQIGSRIGLLSDAVVIDLELTRGYLEALGTRVVATAMIGYESDYDDMQSALSSFGEAGVDLVVAIGGGSVIDAAKMVSAAMSAGVDLWSIRSLAKLPGPKIPVVALPTTFGAGSEVNMYGHLYDRRSGSKQSVKKSFLTPDYALVNPDFSKALPFSVKYLCGIDAFVHAFESLTLKREKSPLELVLLKHAIDLFLRHFRNYLFEPGAADEDAIALGALLAGLGVNNSRTGLIHSMAAPLARRLGISHARSILPFILPVLGKNWEHLGDRWPVESFEKLSRIIRHNILLCELDPLEIPAQVIADLDDMVQECCGDTVIFKENPAPLSAQVLKGIYLEVLHGPGVRPRVDVLATHV